MSSVKVANIIHDAYLNVEFTPSPFFWVMVWLLIVTIFWFLIGKELFIAWYSGVEIDVEAEGPQKVIIDVQVDFDDTLQSLASDFDTNVETILELNPEIKSDIDIKPGILLKIPYQRE